PPGRLVGRHAPQLQRKQDVLEHGGPRHERRLLEHEADVALRQAGPAVAAGPFDAAARDLAEPGDQPQHRALAASGRTEQAQELSLADTQIEATEGDDAVAVDLVDVLQLDDGAAYGFPVLRLIPCFLLTNCKVYARLRSRSAV